MLLISLPSPIFYIKRNDMHHNITSEMILRFHSPHSRNPPTHNSGSQAIPPPLSRLYPCRPSWPRRCGSDWAAPCPLQIDIAEKKVGSLNRDLCFKRWTNYFLGCLQRVLVSKEKIHHRWLRIYHRFEKFRHCLVEEG